MLVLISPDKLHPGLQSGRLAACRALVCVQNGESNEQQTACHAHDSRASQSLTRDPGMFLLELALRVDLDLPEPATLLASAAFVLQAVAIIEDQKLSRLANRPVIYQDML